MHMSDALLSPTVGLAGWLLAGGVVALVARAVTREDRGVEGTARMGVLGAFVFAAQMVNFAIPGTGSSGHLGGGLLLAVLLGPWRAFLVMASVLAIQALFFADGGLLAWGCNLLNLGLIPCFVAFPLVYLPISGKGSAARRGLAALLASLVALELGALAVVLQTTLSGIVELPFGAFAALMLPVHLAIGLVEGLATASVLTFLLRVEPGFLESAPPSRQRLLPALGLLTLLVGGVVSWFASTRPDGLEWSVSGTAGVEEPASGVGALHHHLAELQEKSSVMPDYAIAAGDPGVVDETRVRLDPGRSLAGVTGSIATFAILLLSGLLLGRLGGKGATKRASARGGP
jgi:cobalt/nickel transport system permease protein